MEIPHCDGLPFLVAQGVGAANHFKVKALVQRKSGKSCEICATKGKHHSHRHAWRRKTTVGKALGEEMGRTCVDVDHELEKKLETFPHTLQNKGNLPSREKRRK